MTDAIAICGLGAILPDAPDVEAFWRNIAAGHYAISDVDPERWDPALYYDPDPRAPERTYSKIGGWVRDWPWDPFAWKLPIPPKVADGMDDAQKWAIACSRMALLDYGWPERPLDLERTAVVLGNAIAGEKHYLTNLRLSFPEIARELERSPSFAALPADARALIEAELHGRLDAKLPPVTEDTMPGELGNCLAGRIANLFNLHGPNFVVDAACASAMAAMEASIDGLVRGEFDAVLTGGIDRNMGASSFIKFCAIGALSATGTRPYAAGADGFVMGEGGAVFVLKRLADAEAGGDKIYAVVRAIAGASDGKGKGITAPNPVGQRLAVERAWAASGLTPDACGLVEGHGTSTAVGDVVELGALSEAFGALPHASVALGSVKSNIGHLKAAAGAAGMLKATLALHHGQLPPSLHFESPNPNVDWSASPFRVQTELAEWPNGRPRVAGVSAFGFGGTNFHAVLEEHVPGRLDGEGRTGIAVPADVPAAAPASAPPAVAAASPAAPAARGERAPLRGLLVLGAADAAALRAELELAVEAAREGSAPAPAAPAPETLRAPERLAIDFGDASELAAKGEQALKAFEAPAMWRALRARGIFRGTGPAGKVAFLYTGQGSQYVNMLAELRATEPVVAEVFDRADAVMRPLLGGRALSDVIFVDPADEAAVAQATAELMRTEITQPAVLAVDHAITRLLAAYGMEPDLVMGHSLGEYGALVAAGSLSFEEALEAVSARGREMASLRVEDNGAMAAVTATLEEVEEVLASVGPGAVVANVNSTKQLVIGGATAPVERAIDILTERGRTAIRLPVSHAFHTSIVAPASEPLRAMLRRLHLRPPRIPLVANVDAKPYPADDVEAMIDILGRQVASPVQFVGGLRTLRDMGARVFVECGPKRALQGFAADVLGEDDVLCLHTNHPKLGDVMSFNQALAGMYAAGHGAGTAPAAEPAEPARRETAREPVVVTGASLGLPGTERTFDDTNVGRILGGQQLIDVIPAAIRHGIVDRHITRLVKGDDGSAEFEFIDDAADVIKLAARAGALDLAEEFGVERDRIPALGRATQLAIAAGLDAMRDAGLPLVQHYRTTSKGTLFPDRWGLPEALRDDTGIIFASAFPGLEEFGAELDRYWSDRSRREQLAALEALRSRFADVDGVIAAELDHRIHDLRASLEADHYEFDRRFLFRLLSMGHSQFAELIGARGPNTQVNAACASTTQAVAVAEDWIAAGRCRRVIVVAADDATSDEMLPWIGSGFLASGAAATDEDVEKAALPFDERRHGMLLGMGAAAIVVESADAARERGLAPICEVVGTVTANSAFHGTRLDVGHIGAVMETVVAQAEARGYDRAADAAETVFVSHETYTPARGGSAAAEIHALRAVFGDRADAIVIANTKGFTGHPMGVGIEDIVAIKALETGVVPPVPNFRDADPELGELNLSKGGAYPIRYALRLAAGFGSQIAMVLLRWTPAPDGRRRHPDELGYAYRVADRAAWDGWLAHVSGQAEPRLEVDHRRLRVVAPGVAPPAVPEPVPEPASAPVAEPEPVAAPAPAPAAAPAPVAEVPATGEILDRILAIVAEQTGYPADMLDPELDLEADLGIDTVKQAEVFVAIREAYGIERDASLKLRDYPTLDHVVEFVRTRAAGPAPEPPRPEHPTVAAAPAEPGPGALPEAAPPAAGDVLEEILGIVAEQTGYPADMLDPELDLEADLGIDTVKQAEVFVEIRERYGIERDASLKLRDYPTLDHVVAFVRERTGGAAAATAAAPEPEAPVPAAAPPLPEAAPPAAGDVLEEILGIVAEQTGYPADMLDPELDLEADLGIDTVKQAEVFVAIRERYGIERDASLKLRDYPTLDHVVAFVRERTGGAATPAPEPAPAPTAAAAPPPPIPEDPAFPRRVPVPALRPALDLCAETGARLGRVMVVDDAGGVGAELRRLLAERGATLVDAGPVDGVYWLPALDPDDATDIPAALATRVKRLAETMRDADPSAFLVAATRLGGRHGYGPDGAASMLGGGVTGFAKALARERDAALVKAVDFAVDADAATVARTLLEETLRDPGAVEVGHADGLRWTVALAERPAVPGTPLTPDMTFLVTGAAGSIVSAITADLARAAGGGTFHLLDLTPAPDGSDPDLSAFRTDKEALKRALADRMRAAGGKPTPKLVERELSRIERACAAQDAIAAVEAAGATARWHQVDLTDARAVKDAVPDGRVDVLLHCAGLEISHFLPDKPQSEFDLVFDVKALGWFHVLAALGEIGTAVVFSSIAGRFGNAGQTDYAAANDLLCKSVAHLRTRGVRGIAIDWTAWARIGMASRGSIPKMMELAGIDMLPPELGIPAVRREITAAGPGSEAVVAGALGVLLDERHPTGGLDLAKANAALAAAGPMTGAITAMTVLGGLRMELELDPARQAFLDDHRIEGVPVLPGVMGMEAFAETAAALLPGHTLRAIEDVELRAPFKFYRDQPRTLELRALLTAGDAGEIVAECALSGRRTLASGEEQETLHFTGRVRLAREAAGGPAPHAPTLDAGRAVGHDAVYDVYFHGPAYQVLDRAWRANGDIVGRLADPLPADHEPATQPLAADPRLIELCFQTAGIYELGTAGRMALPTHVDRVARFAAAPGDGAGGTVYAIVTPRGDGAIDADVVDEAGHVRLRMEGYRTIELPGDIDADKLTPIREAMA